MILGLSIFIFYPSKQKIQNLIFISLDTTRSDFINTGKGARANTPKLKRFSNRAVVFENAYATIPQTLPSHLSILTSRFPHELGVLSNENEYDGRHKMIQEVLKEKGYFTAGLISLGTVSGKTGISRGFDEYNESLFKSNRFYVNGEVITRTAVAMLDKMKNTPFFLFAHYSDPHSPYAPPGKKCDFTIRLNGKPIAFFNAYEGNLLRMKIPLKKGSHTLSFSKDFSNKDFKFFIIRKLNFSKNCTIKHSSLEFSKDYYQGSHIFRGSEGEVKINCNGPGLIKIFQIIPILSKEAAITCYTQEVEYLDKQVGKLLKSLERMTLMDNTIVVIFADHGEGLGERDGYFGHVRYLNQQFIRVPLMVYIPGVKAKHIRTPVSMVGVTPTIISAMDIKTSDVRMTENWMPLIKKKTKRWKKPILSFAFKPSSTSDKLSVIKWPYQAIYNPASQICPAKEFYNLNISQSFSKFDQIDKKVMITSSNKDYRNLVNEIRIHKDIFYRKFPLIMVNAQSIEKLKILGYIN